MTAAELIAAHERALASGMHECASDCPPLRAQVSPWPRQLHPPVLTFADLQRWLDRRLSGVDADLGDGETLQSLGAHGEARLKERRATLLDVAFAIAPGVAEEYDARRQDRIEAEYREAYGPDADKLATYQAEGR